VLEEGVFLVHDKSHNGTIASLVVGNKSRETLSAFFRFSSIYLISGFVFLLSIVFGDNVSENLIMLSIISPSPAYFKGISEKV